MESSSTELVKLTCPERERSEGIEKTKIIKISSWWIIPCPYCLMARLSTYAILGIRSKQGEKRGERHLFEKSRDIVEMWVASVLARVLEEKSSSGIHLTVLHKISN